MTRNELIRRYRESERRTTAPQLDALTPSQTRREYAQQDRLLDRYGESLPALPLSRCPHCGEVLEYAFDAEGLDGMWWQQDGIVAQRAPDESHHRLMLGAIDFHGRQPEEAAPNQRVLPGPGAPFVIARLLQMEGMVAVISSLTLPRGDTAYLIAYYCPAQVNPFHLHQPWGRELVAAEGGWGMATDPWDFELQPWIDAGKLKWIEAGDADLVLRDTGPCPYVGLPGVRQPQSIDHGQLMLLPPPDGRAFDPFD